jgi:hypothetical protein
MFKRMIAYFVTVLRRFLPCIQHSVKIANRNIESGFRVVFVKQWYAPGNLALPRIVESKTDGGVLSFWPAEILSLLKYWQLFVLPVSRRATCAEGDNIATHDGHCAEGDNIATHDGQTNGVNFHLPSPSKYTDSIEKAHWCLFSHTEAYSSSADSRFRILAEYPP